jgi:hypothetical protein
MSTTGAQVTPLRRPPVRQSVVVRSDRPHTFGTFGPFTNAQEDGAMAIFTTREAAEEFVRGNPQAAGSAGRWSYAVRAVAMSPRWRSAQPIRLVSVSCSSRAISVAVYSTFGGTVG